MKLPCPHCSQHLELDPETLIALEGASHFDCPSCGGAVDVPTPVLVPTKQTPPTQKGKPTPERVARGTQQGSNRNLLVLGVVALLAIGGVAIFLASKSGGNIFNIFQNTTNQIINNSYFTQLIADGVTTKEDLEGIAEIRPYGDGFIGVTKEPLSWDQAQEFAKRTGSRILEIDQPVIESREELVTSLANTFDSHLSFPTWVLVQNLPEVLARSEILPEKTMEAERKVLVQWGDIDRKSICIEAESLVSRSKPSTGVIRDQLMTGFGRGWSDDRQLWWSGGKPSDALALPLIHDDLVPGSYDVTLYPTTSHNYAQIEVTIYGQTQNVDLLTKHVLPGRSLHFKDVIIKPDVILDVIITILDRNDSKNRYMVGIDRIELRPSKVKDGKL